MKIQALVICDPKFARLTEQTARVIAEQVAGNFTVYSSVENFETEFLRRALRGRAERYLFLI